MSDVPSPSPNVMGAGAPEMQITPEMMLAGLAALPYFSHETLDSRQAEILVLEVYRAMCIASQPSFCRPETS
jgi:hypothetical protein